MLVTTTVVVMAVVIVVVVRSVVVLVLVRHLTVLPGDDAASKVQEVHRCEYLAISQVQFPT
jgi:hypothetical protein